MESEPRALADPQTQPAPEESFRTSGARGPGHFSPAEWRIVRALNRKPEGTTAEDLLRVCELSPGRLSVWLRRLVSSGYATVERILDGGRGRPELLYRPADSLRFELRARIKDFLDTYIQTKDGLELLHETLEGHARSELRAWFQEFLRTHVQTQDRLQQVREALDEHERFLSL